MGINDRHYVRRRVPGASYGEVGHGRPRFGLGWSVNTWIIVLCVAVFVIDGFLPTRAVLSGRRLIAEGVTVDPAQLVVQDVQPQLIVDPNARQQLTVQPLLAYPGGPQVGWAEVLLMKPISALLYFSTSRGFIKLELWRLIGFQFLHANATHLIVNMIGLFFFGPLVEQYLGRKRFLAFYLLCGIFGAILYLVLNLGGFVISEWSGHSVVLPGLLFSDIGTPLVGASAGIFGVLMAGAYLAPNAIVLAFFIFPMRLVTLAYALVIVALATIIMGGHNAGGEAGHLGGAIAGFYFIRHPHHLHGFFDILGRVDPTSHHYRRGTSTRRAPGVGSDRAEIDRILDKISVGGLQSLNDNEKRILREASENP